MDTIKYLMESPDTPVASVLRPLATTWKEASFHFRSFEFKPGRYDQDFRYEDKVEHRLTGAEIADGLKLQAILNTAQNKGWDVTVSSLVRVGKDMFTEELHLPMLDFACSPDSPEMDAARVDNITTKAGLDLSPWTFFDSGRSFHGYGQKLISTKEWLTFLGSALLMNVPPEEGDLGFRIVDERWIGHCLRKGFASLRLTKNSDKYKCIPTRICSPFTPGEFGTPLADTEVPF